MNYSETKEKLRQTFLDKRLQLNPEEVRDASQKIAGKLISQPLWQKAERIGLYASIRNEVDTNSLLMNALEEEKNVYYPRVEKGIRFYQIQGPGELQKGAWGIFEPMHDCPTLLENETLDLIIVPGVAFDKRGFRLGYGKGFYDVLLEKYENTSIGLAYEFQMVEEVPVDDWDRPVKRVMTEKKEYVF